MRRLVFWAAPPFVLPQAVRVRRNAPRFPAPEGPRSGSVGTGRALRLLAIGDSIVVGVGAKTMEQSLVGRVASRLADRLPARIDWTAVGSIGATTAKVHCQLLPRVAPVQVAAGPGRFSADAFHPFEASYVEFGDAMADALLRRWTQDTDHSH